ncbi:HNH endonuclease signature motif containing protein [Nocardia africana]
MSVSRGANERQLSLLDLLCPVEPQGQSTCYLTHCDEPRHCKGLCESHYYRQRGGGHNWDRPLGMCREDDCVNRVTAHHRYCDPCKQERKRKSNRAAYRRAPEKSAERRKLYYAANSERLKKMNRDWHAANPGYSTKASKQWHKDNPIRSRAIYARKRAKRTKWIAETQVDPVDYREIIAEHGMWCHICDKAIESEADLQFDHVRPLSKGGPHTKENLKPSHALCNARKGDRLLDLT